MSPILKNIVAVILGLLLGGLVNSGIILLSPNLIDAPMGVDPNDLESIKTNAGLYEAKHFIVPFLAHSIGTLTGAFIAVKIASSHHKTIAYIVAGFFIIGGAMMAYMLPEFWKFSIIDLTLAYFPMAMIGWKLAEGEKNDSFDR